MKNKKLGLKSIALLLMLLTVFTALPAYASGSDAVHVFEKRDYYTSNKKLEDGRQYEVPENGILRIEKGATLYVEGELKVYGTLKNYGTIIVREREPKITRRESSKDDTYGHISIMGELQNYGDITIKNASIHNRISGKITNNGNITITGDNPDLVYFRNIGRVTSEAKQGGTVVNETGGTITIAITEGTGLVNQSGATFENKGEVIIKRGSQARGAISDNPVKWMD